MLKNNRPDEIADHDGSGAETSASVALVPLVPPDRRARRPRLLTRPDPTFVTHLIATAEHAPQTRNLRRAAPSDALSAYTAQRRPLPDAGGRTRQVV